MALNLLLMTMTSVLWFYQMPLILSPPFCSWEITSFPLSFTLILFLILICLLIFNLFNWFTDILEESIFSGDHTSNVANGLILGIILFIISEVMFFFSLFWAFFHFSLSPNIWMGGWVPKGMRSIPFYGMPLANTILLLTSGASVTLAHTAILSGARGKLMFSLLVTVLLALFFLSFQILEFSNAPFSINDSVYGSIFFMMAGFHGFHVLMGTVMLLFCFVRACGVKYSMYVKNHVGFLCAMWYWHFVDVVWLFVWFFLYLWGGVCFGDFILGGGFEVSIKSSADGMPCHGNLHTLGMRFRS